MNLLKTVVPIGLSPPVTALHLTDARFCPADGTDPPRVREMAAARKVCFDGSLPNGVMQYVTDGLFRGPAREITFI